MFFNEDHDFSAEEFAKINQGVFGLLEHSRTEHRSEEPSPDCEICVAQVRGLILTASVNASMIQRAIEDGIPVPRLIRPVIDKILELEGVVPTKKEEDPWQ